LPHDASAPNEDSGSQEDSEASRPRVVKNRATKMKMKTIETRPEFQHATRAREGRKRW